MTSTGRAFTKEFLGGLATDIRNLIDTVAFPTRKRQSNWKYSMQLEGCQAREIFLFNPHH